MSGPIAPDLLAELKLLFKCLAIKDGAETDALVNYRLYADALRDLPMAELSPVMRAFRIGDKGDGKWCPKPAEIRREVLARVERAAAARRQEKLDREMFEARRAAERRGPNSPEEVERVKEMVSRLKASMPKSGSTEPTKRQPTQEEAREWLEAHENGAGIAPVTQFSPALIEQLKGERPIGSGKLGCSALMTDAQRRAYDDARFADMDQFARETIG